MDQHAAHTDEDIDELQHSLQQIEDNLGGPASAFQAPAVGRSGWSSLGSALQNIRRRIGRLVNHNSATCSDTPASPSDGRGDVRQASSPSATSCSAASSLTERLRVAELAHSTRTPLRRLESELRRRQESRNADVLRHTPMSDGSMVENPHKRRRRSSMLASRSNNKLKSVSDLDVMGTVEENEQKGSADPDSEDSILHKRLATIRVLSDVDEASMQDASGADSTKAVVSRLSSIIIMLSSSTKKVK